MTARRPGMRQHIQPRVRRGERRSGRWGRPADSYTYNDSDGHTNIDADRNADSDADRSADSDPERHRDAHTRCMRR